jgi:hypothetical protein
MRVVCAACNEHYADLDDSMEFESMLVYSDALAVYHLAHCQASRDEKDAAWEMMEAASKVDTEQ